MTILEWLRSRTPPAPPALQARLEWALGANGGRDISSAWSVLLDAAVSLLSPLVARADAGRDCALDLLAADALVTYAFESASSDVDRLDARGLEAMRHLAALAADAEVRASAPG